MRKTNLALGILLCTAIIGCVPSLYPLLTSADRTLDPTLEGAWHAKEQNVTFTLARNPEDKNYFLHTESQSEQTAPGEFIANLGSVGTNRYLEIWPRRPDSIHAKSFFGGHFIQASSFWKVDHNGNKLTLASLNLLAVDAAIKANKFPLKYEKQAGGLIVLTASTDELKAFVLKYGSDENTFSDRIVFDRKK